MTRQGSGLRTALVVEVPEVEPAVGDIRRDLDPMAGRGVPPHVTVLFPFVPLDELDTTIVARLESVFRQAAPFEHCFVGTRWFGDDVLWLASDADVQLRGLTDLVVVEFPACQPYGGEHAEVVPHLTIADHAPLDAMRFAAAEVGPRLPICVVTTSISLLAERPSGDWTMERRFDLGRCAAQPVDPLVD
ncbi:2'-5' RNA ligase family protein [Janibacter limosus]|uniref:2'-5' RNA ligase family protein n=1 Tax=Janibacter limosus TaxID=53458 RepID=A0A4P6MR89_9MICO|nr:2'-5' RNA ligase family protein [Janibacter limosus]QBF46034.1 2'-5' RNA ligase family protein [Janibacter limosus]